MGEVYARIIRTAPAVQENAASISGSGVAAHSNVGVAARLKCQI
jgi:hypothetical protein